MRALRCNRSGAFEELVQRFPESRYADDSRQRMLYLKNLLAMHEIHAARYYMKRGAWLAAANRARYVVENFQRTPAVSDALAVMTIAYREMGLDALSAGRCPGAAAELSRLRGVRRNGLVPRALIEVRAPQNRDSGPFRRASEGNGHSDCVFVLFAGADPNDLRYRRDEDLPRHRSCPCVWPP